MLTSESLGHLGNLPESYRHEWRVATPLEPIVVPDGVFKWYHVHREGVGVDEHVDRTARELICDGAMTWNLEYGLNFALLHQSLERAFLIIGVWRGHQELWSRAYEISLADGDCFRRIEATEEFWPTACVWEMGVIQHERMAWHRYLFTEHTDADKLAWLDDCYAGMV
jgi:hypothetical protein